MKDRLKVEFPSQGWKQILSAKTKMLADYDDAREKAKSRKVETYHGHVAESVFRKRAIPRIHWRKPDPMTNAGPLWI